MKPTISELLAGAWPSHEEREQPSTLDKGFIWEPVAGLTTAFGFPADTLFALHRTTPRRYADLALVKVVRRDGTFWHAGRLVYSRQTPGEVVLAEADGTMKLSSTYPGCTISIIGRLVPLEQYRLQLFNRN